MFPSERGTYTPRDDLLRRNLQNKLGKVGLGCLSGRARQLCGCYRTWAGGAGEHAVSGTLFGRSLMGRGFAKEPRRYGTARPTPASPCWPRAAGETMARYGQRQAGKRVHGLMDATGLQILGLEAGLSREYLHRRGAERDPITVGEQEIGPAGTFQDPMRGSALAFDAPADAKESRQGPLGLGGRPILNGPFRPQRRIRPWGREPLRRAPGGRR